MSRSDANRMSCSGIFPSERILTRVGTAGSQQRVRAPGALPSPRSVSAAYEDYECHRVHAPAIPSRVHRPAGQEMVVPLKLARSPVAGQTVVELDHQVEAPGELHDRVRAHRLKALHLDALARAVDAQEVVGRAPPRQAKIARA